MTQEEKVRAYNKALEKAKEIKSKILSSHLSTESCKAVSEYIDEIIPELAESEDERIRKFLINLLSHGTWKKEWPFSPPECVAWLEKQKEQKYIDEKSVDEIGKSVRRKWAIDFIHFLDEHRYDGKMCVSNGECMDIENAFINADWEKLIRYYNKYTRKLAEISDLRTWEKVVDMVLTEHNGIGQYLDNPDTERIAKRLEERFSLPNRKPAEWSEEDAEKLRLCADALDVGQTKQHIYQHGIVPDELKSWLKSLRPQPKIEWDKEDEKMRWDLINAFMDKNNSHVDDFMQNRSSKAEVIDWLKSLPGRFNLQSKAEWSEEDEKTIDDAYCWLCEYAGSLIQKNYGKSSMLYGIANKLKSLRPQPKQEWSEEDEKMRCNILNVLTPNLVYSCGKGTSTGTSMYKYDEEIKWLKSLPQRFSLSSWGEEIRDGFFGKFNHNSWKPSEEQMTNLLRAEGRLRIEGESILASKLAELYEQLKAL